jgi:hypothetical protein
LEITHREIINSSGIDGQSEYLQLSNITRHRVSLARAISMRENELKEIENILFR